MAASPLRATERESPIPDLGDSEDQTTAPRIIRSCNLESAIRLRPPMSRMLASLLIGAAAALAATSAAVGQTQGDRPLRIIVFGAHHPTIAARKPPRHGRAMGRARLPGQVRQRDQRRHRPPRDGRRSLASTPPRGSSVVPRSSGSSPRSWTSMTGSCSPPWRTGGSSPARSGNGRPTST